MWCVFIDWWVTEKESGQKLCRRMCVCGLTDVCCEASAQELLSFSLLSLASVPSVLEVPQGCLKMLHIILQLINTPIKRKTQWVSFRPHSSPQAFGDATVVDYLLVYMERSFALNNSQKCSWNKTFHILLTPLHRGLICKLKTIYFIFCFHFYIHIHLLMENYNHVYFWKMILISHC